MTDWSQIVHEHGPMVWRTIDRLLWHEADTADCFQRTFVAAVEFAKRQAIRSWPAVLKRIATQRALERLRQRIRDGERMEPFSGDGLQTRQIDPKSLEPSLAAMAGELASALRRALAEIEPLQAEVFCLAALDESSYKEIAQQLDLTINYVGVLLNRARSSLRRKLKEFEPIDRVLPKAPEPKL